MKTEQARVRKSVRHLTVAIIIGTALPVFVAPAANAANINDVFDRVTDIYQRTRSTLPKNGVNLNNQIDGVSSKVQAAVSGVQDLAAKASVAETIGNSGTMASIIDSVSPIVELVQTRQAEYQAFLPYAETFRGELAGAIDNVANLQMALRGHVGPAITKLQLNLASASPALLFALSETPLLNLIEKTQGMTQEINTLVTITAGAIEDIEANHSAQQMLQLASLGMSIAAPEYVSCNWVLNNVSSLDIDIIGLSRLRAKQMSGIARLALEVLPKSQTIGVNVVGGATLSIPNPVTPMTIALREAADEYYDVSEEWTKKYDECSAEALSNRLSDYLATQGFN